MDNIHILDLSTLLPGPFSSYLLSETGCKVIKVEDSKHPDELRYMWPTDQGVSIAYKAINKGKTTVALDYKDEIDMARLKQYVKETDVVIENFKPGRLDKLGLGFADCQKINPDIIYCSITGFGQNHPFKNKPAHDLNILGLSGYIQLNQPSVIPPLPFADLLTSYEACIQILTALIAKKSTWIDISMLKSITKAQLFLTAMIDHLKRDIAFEEFPLWGGYPCYRLYKTTDSKYMALAALEAPFWVDFCQQIGLSHLTDHQFDSDKQIIDEISHVIEKKTQKEWISLDIDTFTPVLSYLESKQHGYL